MLAEQGLEQATGINQDEACTTARKKAHEDYHIFQMNPRCACKKRENKEWMCEIYFSYLNKKNNNK